ncbi:hypothetical protein CCO03_01490 [Comamonas serinivorans]|uniref:Uncharacterized protein n=2 Tax=Comamonas serinivorans TaxID=1082851 RepID=A0A1Y0EJS4_9BURK|nr:hypothetical protein CCO03_01490 [Comamonas serinivorans]
MPTSGAAPQAPASPAAPAAVQPLTREQALAPQARGARVRWWGGVDRVEADDAGRDCFTLRWGDTDADGWVQWPRDDRGLHPVVACGPGHYPRQLVQPFTLLHIEGRVVGTATVWGVPAPVLEIEVLERASDCLASETDWVKHPQCRSGRLLPE